MGVKSYRALQPIYINTGSIIFLELFGGLSLSLSLSFPRLTDLQFVGSGMPLQCFLVNLHWFRLFAVEGWAGPTGAMGECFKGLNFKLKRALSTVHYQSQHHCCHQLESNYEVFLAHCALYMLTRWLDHLRIWKMITCWTVRWWLGEWWDNK